MFLVCNAAHAQFSAPCDRFSLFCNGSITVGLSHDAAGTYDQIPGDSAQQNRDRYVAGQISNALNNTNDATNYFGATFVVTFSDGSTEKYKFTGSRVNGNAEAIPGTKTGSAGGGNVFASQCSQTITLYGNYFVTVTTQGGVEIGRVTEYVYTGMEVSGCEFSTTNWG